MLYLQAAGEESAGSIASAVSDSLTYLEHHIPGSCEVLVSTLLQQLRRSVLFPCFGVTFVASNFVSVAQVCGSTTLSYFSLFAQQGRGRLHKGSARIGS